MIDTQTSTRRVDMLKALKQAKRAIHGLLRVDRKASTTGVSGTEDEHVKKAARQAIKAIEAFTGDA